MKKIYTIGRDPQSDIVINDNTDVVSRLHATIRIDGKKMFLIDQSQNGTYINGMRMSANEEIPITREDTISFANVAEFDWNLLPNPKKAQMKSIGLIVVALIAIVVIILGVLNFMDDTENTDKTTTEDASTTLTTDTTAINNDKEDKVVPDTVSIKDATTPKEETTFSPTGNKKNAGLKDNKEKQPTEDKKETPTPENNIPLY